MKTLLTFLILGCWPVFLSCVQPQIPQAEVEAIDSLAAAGAVPDSIVHRSLTLTERDFEEAAAELGVDVAAIRAVVEIEAGVQHKGFWKEGHPLINFDLSMFRAMAKRHNINLTKYAKTHPVVFAAPNRAKYGGYSPAQQARLESALTIDTVAAIEGTFWGMFQIGGFNWRKCGAESAVDFAQKMARSEREQLELFIQFLRTTGLDKHLKTRNWAAFARGYNGPSYARRGYHTKLARAYAKYKK